MIIRKFHTELHVISCIVIATAQVYTPITAINYKGISTPWNSSFI